MPYTPAGKNLMLDALAPDHVSIHTAEPDNTGSSEVAGGEYARQAIAWNAASAGSKDDSTNGAQFKVPAGTHVKFVGFWKEGVFVGSAPCTEEVFAAAGTYTLTDVKLNLGFTKE